MNEYIFIYLYNDFHPPYTYSYDGGAYTYITTNMHFCFRKLEGDFLQKFQRDRKAMQSLTNRAKPEKSYKPCKDI